MNNKIVLITGSTDGLGKESAIQLAKQGYHVIIHGRNDKKALGTLKQIRYEVKNSEVSYVVGDLRSISEVKSLVNDIYSKYSKLDILINNAGILNDQRKLTKDGLEETIVVNYIAPFYLTSLLINLLKKGKNSRIIND